MARRLPNLNQLRAFEAAARLQSFKAAADELHVTQAAISHQIKALEAYFGRQLFNRGIRQVELSPDAADYAEKLTSMLDQVSEASSTFLTQSVDRPFRITSAPYFGNRVVFPALADFTSQHPEIDLELSLDYHFVDLRAAGFDAGLRYGDGNWPGCSAIKIYSDIVTPLAAPSLVANKTLPLSPQDIASLPLAVDNAGPNDWPAWFEQVGFMPKDPLKFWRFDNRALILDFALAGNGVVLTDLRIAHNELLHGQLTRLHPTTLDMPGAFYLAYPESDEPDPRVTLFADWLRTTVQAMDLTVGTTF